MYFSRLLQCGQKLQLSVGDFARERRVTQAGALLLARGEHPLKKIEKNRLFLRTSQVSRQQPPSKRRDQPARTHLRRSAQLQRLVDASAHRPIQRIREYPV